jgi:flagellin
MPLVINTNVASLNAQRNLTTSQNALNTALARLSSGLRINSAKDDAAGLAIATRFTTQINGLDQAVRNANDGISLAQTTGSALAEVTNNMQRIRELAVQSANATNSDSDRAALDAEVQQRLAEITRISQQTTFNGRHVLDGSFGSAAFQIGANVGETITVNLSQGAGAGQVGQIATSASGDLSSLFPAATGGTPAVDGTATTTVDLGTALGTGIVIGTGDLTVGGTDVASATYTDGNTLAAAIATAGGAGVSATFDSTTNEITITNSNSSAVALAGTKASSVFGTITTVAAQTPAVAGTSAGLTLAAGDLTINGTDMAGTYKDAQSLVDAINAKGIDGVAAYYDDTNGEMHLTSQKALTVDGTKAGTGTGDLGFSNVGTAVAVGGSLAGSSVDTVAGAKKRSAASIRHWPPSARCAVTWARYRTASSPRSRICRRYRRTCRHHARVFRMRTSPPKPRR